MKAHDIWIRPRLARTPAAQAVSLPLAPSRERRRLQTYLGLLILDGAAIVAGFAGADLLYPGSESIAQGLLQAQLVLPLFWTAALMLRAYSIPALLSRSFGVSRTSSALGAAAALLLLLAYILKLSTFLSRGVFALGVPTALLFLALGRLVSAPLVHRMVGATAINVLVIDDGGDALRVPHAWHIDAREHGLHPDLGDPHMLDRIGLYLANMDRVIVTCAQDRRVSWSMIFQGANVRGEIVDREVTALGVIGAFRSPAFGSLVVSAGPLGMRARMLKRALDLSVSTALLLVLSPVLLVTALCILIEDGRPVFFVQSRMGRGNTFFRMLKFRSMRAAATDHTGAVSASRDDARITRMGRFIRRTSIDELPQLLNVLKGQMSLVGPRPHAIASLAGDKLFWEVDHRYWLRHALKPGLTGLAQIRGLRGATDAESDLSHRLHADLEYLAGWSIWRDIAIILATLRVVVHSRAY